MKRERCPTCGKSVPDQLRAEEVPPVTREQVIEWMRDAGDSAAGFFEAAANYFGVEDEELARA